MASHRSHRSALYALLALIAVGCASARSAPAPAPAFQAATASTPSQARGTLFIVGGGPQPPALVQEFVTLAGGPGRARIIVFAMASSDGATSGEEKARDLRALGATALNVFVNHDQANTDSVTHLLDGATSIWFGGGDQVLLAKALRGTRTERAMHERYAAGAVVGGTSAGAAVISAAMITGDERRPGGDRPDTTTGFMTIARDNIVVADGFAFLDDAIVDQHFLRRKRHNRLMSLVIERAPHLGVGIDESTALVVEPDGRWRVSGASAAVVYDARRSTTTTPGTALGATGIMVHVLPAGSRFDPRTGEARLP
ncbi:MAG: cyanophycinase [Gemmatimonadaceae bacterium]